jgi:hypothetical protein
LKYHKEHPAREQNTSPSFLFQIDDIIMPKASLYDRMFRVHLQPLYPVGADIATAWPHGYVAW